MYATDTFATRQAADVLEVIPSEACTLSESEFVCECMAKVRGGGNYEENRLTQAW